jgi:hypothetical protein
MATTIQLPRRQGGWEGLAAGRLLVLGPVATPTVAGDEGRGAGFLSGMHYDRPAGSAARTVWGCDAAFLYACAWDGVRHCPNGDQSGRCADRVEPR